MKLETVTKKIAARLDAYFHGLGFSDTDIETLKLYRIETVENSSKRYTDINIYGELDIEEFFEVQQALDKLVENVDPAAYFDVVDGGMFTTRIYWDSAQANSEKSDTVLNRKNLIKFGEALASDLDLDYNQSFWVDDISYNKAKQRLDISVSSNSYKSEVSVKIYEYDLDTYDDLVSEYFHRVRKQLDLHMEEL